jgi:hypothetical protein
MTDNSILFFGEEVEPLIWLPDLLTRRYIGIDTFIANYEQGKALRDLDFEAKKLFINKSMNTIKNSPDLEEKYIVSAQVWGLISVSMLEIQRNHNSGNLLQDYVYFEKGRKAIIQNFSWVDSKILDYDKSNRWYAKKERKAKMKYIFREFLRKTLKKISFY